MRQLLLMGMIIAPMAADAAVIQKPDGSWWEIIDPPARYDSGPFLGSGAPIITLMGKDRLIDYCSMAAGKFEDLACSSAPTGD